MQRSISLLNVECWTRVIALSTIVAFNFNISMHSSSFPHCKQRAQSMGNHFFFYSLNSFLAEPTEMCFMHSLNILGDSRFFMVFQTDQHEACGMRHAHATEKCHSSKIASNATHETAECSNKYTRCQQHPYYKVITININSLSTNKRPNARRQASSNAQHSAHG